MAKNNAIVEIQGTDLISESMHKINENFKVLAETEEQDRYKWQTYVDSVNSKIEELKSLTNSKNSAIEENIHSLADEIKNVPSIDNLQKQVNDAIGNATDIVANVISTNAGNYISNALSGYVKTTSMDDKLKDYVLTTGFDEYKSDADKRIATANRVVANSTFATTDDGYFIYLSSGEKSQYNSIESYYNAIKSEIDPTNKGINDTDVYDTLLARCESTFKTVVNEITTIRQEVGEGTSSASIVAAVKGALGAGDSGDDAEDIAASIFAQANEDGSSITLRANQIDLTSDSLNVTTGQFTVNADDNDDTQSNANFRLKANGDVTVKGNITATSLIITSGSSAENTLKSFIENVGTEKHWGDTPDSYSDTWLTNAFSKTVSSGGLLMTGNLLVGDSDSNVTAGMMGASTSSTDLRFFAGSNLAGSSNAPFRVYENGKMIAGDVDLNGGKIGKININQDGLTVGDKIFIGKDSTYGDCIKITDNLDNVSVLSSDKLIMSGSFSYKTAYLVGDLGAVVWEGEEDETAEKIENLKSNYDIYPTNSVGDLFTKYDIINVCLSGDVTLPSDSKYIGRKITFMHGHPLSSNVVQIVEDSGLSYSYSLGGSYCDCKFASGSNCKFYEDGGKSSTLHLSNEAVEMIGVGIGGTFMGFIISKRYNITTEKEYGHELRCLGMFKVTTSSSNPYVTSKTYSNQNATISKSGNDYVISTPFKITDTSNVVVNITSEGQSGITYGYSLASTNSKLVITIKSSDISKTFKVTVFNFSDFSSLKLDTWSNS